MLYAAIHIAIAFCCHCGWAIGFHALRALWARPRARRALDAVIGFALLALAVRILRP